VKEWEGVEGVSEGVGLWRRGECDTDASSEWELRDRELMDWDDSSCMDQKYNE
jgi:hypothetical protein